LNSTILHILYTKKIIIKKSENVLIPPKFEQENINDAVNNLLYGIKVISSLVTEKVKSILSDSTKNQIKCDVETVILGCSELSIAISREAYIHNPLIAQLKD